MIAYIFTATCRTEKTRESIEIAIAAAKMLRLAFFLEEDCALVGFHSRFHAARRSNNVEIWLENDNVHQLIKDAMRFASERTRLEIARSVRRDK